MSQNPEQVSQHRIAELRWFQRFTQRRNQINFNTGDSLATNRCQNGADAFIWILMPEFYHANLFNYMGMKKALDSVVFSIYKVLHFQKTWRQKL